MIWFWLEPNKNWIVINSHDYDAILFNLEFDSAGNLRRLVCFCNIALKVIGLASRKIFLHEKPKTLCSQDRSCVWEYPIWKRIRHYKSQKQKSKSKYMVGYAKGTKLSTGREYNWVLVAPFPFFGSLVSKAIGPRL